MSVLSFIEGVIRARENPESSPPAASSAAPTALAASTLSFWGSPGLQALLQALTEPALPALPRVVEITPWNFRIRGLGNFTTLRLQDTQLFQRVQQVANLLKDGDRLGASVHDYKRRSGLPLEDCGMRVSARIVPTMVWSGPASEQRWRIDADMDTASVVSTGDVNQIEAGRSEVNRSQTSQSEVNPLCARDLVVGINLDYNYPATWVDDDRRPLAPLTEKQLEYVRLLALVLAIDEIQKGFLEAYAHASALNAPPDWFGYPRCSTSKEFHYRARLQAGIAGETQSKPETTKRNAPTPVADLVIARMMGSTATAPVMA